MISQLKEHLAYVSYSTGLTSTVIHGIFAGRSFLPGNKGAFFLILIYHRVNPYRNPFMIDVKHPSSFEGHVRFLRRTFNVLSLDEVMDRLRKGEPVPKKTVVITFDDGYEDNYSYAYPILKKYAVPATVFLTAGNIERRETLWFDKVLTAFEKTGVSSLHVPGTDISFSSLEDRKRRVSSACRLLSFLKRLPNEDRLTMVEEITERLDVRSVGRTSHQLLNWEQVREMAENGISFGSHTMTHPILSTITSDEVREEIMESKQLIEDRIDRPVRFFAYPNGRVQDYSAEAPLILKDAGYEAALTTERGGNFTDSDPFGLKRLNPWEESVSRFALLMAKSCLAP